MTPSVILVLNVEDDDEDEESRGPIKVAHSRERK